KKQLASPVQDRLWKHSCSFAFIRGPTPPAFSSETPFPRHSSPAATHARKLMPHLSSCLTGVRDPLAPHGKDGSRAVRPTHPPAQPALSPPADLHSLPPPPRNSKRLPARTRSATVRGKARQSLPNPFQRANAPQQSRPATGMDPAFACQAPGSPISDLPVYVLCPTETDPARQEQSVV